MKPILSLLLCLMVAMSSSGQSINGCGFKVPPRNVLKTNFQSVYEAKEIVNNMLTKVNWNENFSIREQYGIRNAYATILNKKRWIIYDNEFLEDIDAYASTKWASISVLAHEMGHHYYDHVVSSSGSTPPKEIEADAFSGYVMHKMGASLQESIAAISAIASDRASNSHPAKRDRIDAITKGWNQSATESGANTKPTLPTNPSTPNLPKPNTPSVPNIPAPNTPAPNPNAGTLPDANDPSWIALTIQSNKDEEVFLSDDGKSYSKAVIKTGQPFVFLFEVYNYGWLRLPYYNGYRTYKLSHGKDYSILWNRRTQNWTVVEVKD
jgi:hypothetical protein